MQITAVCVCVCVRLCDKEFLGFFSQLLQTYKVDQKMVDILNLSEHLLVLRTK